MNSLKVITEKNVDLCLDRMKLCKSRNYDQNLVHKGSYNLVVYIDSTSCTTCTIDKLYKWNDFILATQRFKHKVNFIFVVEAKQYLLEDAYLYIESCGLKVPVYIDSIFTFKRNNPQIPKENRYHVFLTDKNGKVLVVGNPKENTHISELIKNITN